MKLEELEHLVSITTPGPWEVNAPNGEHDRPYLKLDFVDDGCVLGTELELIHAGDTLFIAAARTYMPLLIAVAKAAKKQFTCNNIKCDEQNVCPNCVCDLDTALSALEEA